MASLPLALARSPPLESPIASATRRNLNCWSKLPQDLLQMVFQRLGFADFQRAKSVCSFWQSCSRKSEPNNQIPWLILFPKDTNHCLLFNPEEKDKVYKIQDLGNNFAKSFCMATCRSWLLMHDVDYRYGINALPLYDIYILNLLTRERINLPSLVSEYELTPQVLWIDEKTKDYLVIGMFTEEKTVCFKKGDSSWKQTPHLSRIEECFNMVYKDHKLYCLNYYKLKIFDFSGKIPLKTFSIHVPDFVYRRYGLLMRLPGPMSSQQLQFGQYNNYIVVTVGGDVLIVNSYHRSTSKFWKFKIMKMDSSKKDKWEEIFSLGDEAILLDLGITVLAKDIEGIKRNSIYFSVSDSFNEEYDSFIFNLDTKKVEKPHQFVCSSIQFSNFRWFLPSFKRE